MLKKGLVIGILMLGLVGIMAEAAPPYKAKEKANALVILDSTEARAAGEAAKYIKENGGKVIIASPPALRCYIPQDIAPNLIGKHHIASIHHNFVDPSIVEGLGKNAVYAVNAWNSSLDVLPTPILLSPADGTVMGTLTGTSSIAFSWKKLLGGWSRIQIATSTDTDFLQPIVDTLTEEPTYMFLCIYLDPNTSYYWRVQAINLDMDRLSIWTRPFSFKLSEIEVKTGTTPPVPQPLSPQDEAIIDSRIPEWADSPDATGYRVQVSTSPLFNPVWIDGITKTSIFKIFTVKFNTKYYWRVAAFNEAGHSEWSPVWSFNVTEPGPIENDALRLPPEVFKEKR